QTAGLPHYRSGSILERVHLRESAWLEPRRHQEYVAAGLDLMCECVVEGQSYSQAIGEATLRFLKKGFERGIAAGQYHKLKIEIHYLVERVTQQPDAFLRRHPRHHPDHRNVAVGQVEQLAQRAAAISLALAARGRVPSRNHWILRRVPFGVIAAV